MEEKKTLERRLARLGRRKARLERWLVGARFIQENPEEANTLIASILDDLGITTEDRNADGDFSDLEIALALAEQIDEWIKGGIIPVAWAAILVEVADKWIALPIALGIIKGMKKGTAGRLERRLERVEARIDKTRTAISSTA